MGLFDFLTDDEDRTAGRARIGQEPSKPLDPAVVDYLNKKQPTAADAGPPVEAASLSAQYNRLDKDDSAITKAQEDAASKKKWATVLEGLSTAFGGSKHTDTDFYKGLRGDADASVAQARKDKEGKLAGLLARDKVGKAEPNHARAAAAKAVLAKENNIDPKALADLNYEETLEVVKAIKSGDTSASPYGRGLKAITRNGKVMWVRPEDAIGEEVGYKLSIDSTTGTKTSGSDMYSPSVPMMAADGTPLADRRTQLEGQRAYVRGTNTQQVKDEQAVQVAEAAVAKVGDLRTKWKALRRAAEAEGPIGNTGPIGGRLAKAAGSFGVSLGPKTSEAMATMYREAAQYIRDMTGLTSNEPEYQRLLTSTPTLASDDDTFDANFNAWESEVRAVAERKKREAGKKPGAPAADETETPASEYTPEQESAITKFQAKYPAKSREQIISAMRKQNLLP